MWYLKIKHKLPFLVIFMTNVLLTSCGESGGAAPGGSTVTFPNLETTVGQISPSLTGSSQSDIVLPGPDPMTLAVTFSSPSSWSTYDADGRLRDILGSADDTPAPVTRMFVLLRSLQGTIDTISNTKYDQEGNLTDCTSIETGTTISTPFFNGSTTPFFTFTDTNAYSCYFTDDSNGIVLFGRTEQEPTSQCSDDPYIYDVLQGSLATSTNSEQTETRGDSVTLNQVLKFRYNKCDGEVKLIYAHSTYYSNAQSTNDANDIFTSRTELIGNSIDHSFRLRTLKYDHYGDGGYTWFTSRAAGTVLTSSGTANFIIDYLYYNQDQSTVSDTQTFCIRSNTTQGDYTAQAGSNCSGTSDETNFEAITSFSYADIHNPLGTSPFSTEVSDFGL